MVSLSSAEMPPRPAQTLPEALLSRAEGQTPAGLSVCPGFSFVYITNPTWPIHTLPCKRCASPLHIHPSKRLSQTLPETWAAFLPLPRPSPQSSRPHLLSTGPGLPHICTVMDATQASCCCRPLRSPFLLRRCGGCHPPWAPALSFPLLPHPPLCCPIVVLRPVGHSILGPWRVLEVLRALPLRPSSAHCPSKPSCVTVLVLFPGIQDSLQLTLSLS